MRALFLSMMPKPVRILARQTIEVVGHLCKGHLVPQNEHGPLIGMTTIDEQRFYEDCVSTVENIDGEIVDLGCWMCSTTIPLARGVRARGAREGITARKVYAFDRFIWEDWMNPYMPRLSCHYIPGESFLPEARAMLGDLRDSVEIIAADLSQYRWIGRPISILLVDAMKSVELAKCISAQFYPCLVSGSLLLHQDFKHYYTSWIHILQYRLRDYFRFHHETSGGTVAFKTLKTIPNEAIAAAISIADVSDDEVDAAFQYSMGLVSSTGKSAVAAAHVMHFVHRSEKRAAENTAQRYTKLEHPLRGDFFLAKRRLETLA